MNKVAPKFVCTLPYTFHIYGAKVTDKSIFSFQLFLSFQGCQPPGSQRNCCHLSLVCKKNLIKCIVVLSVAARGYSSVDEANMIQTF